ncbi:hypothetical protein PG997_000052 [Apiospora hydei]|uniref:Uncharacterized protein n=1 Tax=Apiospora hydei TaxID=1337664 RepID=A0ABR1X9S6_9PEZI
MEQPPDCLIPNEAAPTPAAPARFTMTGAWSPAEDERLTAAVSTHGTRWTNLAADVLTRNGEQCAKRWNDHVNPALEHGPWSADEDKSLLDLVALHGHNWKLMADACLKSRSSLAIKNRYALLARRQRRHKKRQMVPHGAQHRDTIDGDAQNIHPLPGSSLHMNRGTTWATAHYRLLYRHTALPMRPSCRLHRKTSIQCSSQAKATLPAAR